MRGLFGKSEEKQKKDYSLVQMKYRLLGGCGLRVSEICLGTMTFGDDWGWGAGKDEARNIFDVFVKSGGNFFDTANRYTNGTSEQLLGEFIAAERDKYIVATKYSLWDSMQDPNFAGNHRKNLLRSVQGSLSRLNTHYIDILWIHAWDFTVQVEEIMRTLNDLVSSGQVLHIAISNTPAWIIAQANTIATLRGWAKFEAIQFEYSLIERSAERELIPMAEAFGMSALTWGTLGSGILSGKYLSANSGRLAQNSPRLNPATTRIAQSLKALSEAKGTTPAQLALAWLRGKSFAPIPILGARHASQLQDNLECLSITLSVAEAQALDELSAINPEFPMSILQSSGTRKDLYGNYFDKIVR